MVPARDLVEEDVSGGVSGARRQVFPRGRPLHPTHRSGRKGGQVLSGPCCPYPDGVVETSSGDPLAVRTESHVEDPFAMAPKSAEAFPLRHVPEYRGVVKE